MQYGYAEPTPRTFQQYCLGGLNGTFKEEGEGEVWKFGPNRSKIRSSSSGVVASRIPVGDSSNSGAAAIDRRRDAAAMDDTRAARRGPVAVAGRI